MRSLQVVAMFVHCVGETRLERVPNERRAGVALDAVAVEHPREEGGAVTIEGRLDAEGVLVVLVQVVRVVPSLRDVGVSANEAGGAAVAVGARLRGGLWVVRIVYSLRHVRISVREVAESDARTGVRSPGCALSEGGLAGSGMPQLHSGAATHLSVIPLSPKR